jgi:hypothetical protein
VYTDLGLKESCSALLSDNIYRGCAAYIITACQESLGYGIYNIVFENVFMRVIAEVADDIEFGTLDHLYERTQPR